MQLSTVKSVIIGVSAAAAVIAITGAASGSGVGAVFNLGKTNKVNATSRLTGSTRHSMLSVTNSGAGTALSLRVAKGKAPFSVNSSARVGGLNASLLGGLAASQFVQGGGQSRSFGLTIPATVTGRFQKLLAVPGFGTFRAQCLSGGGVLADVVFRTGSRAVDRFSAALDSAKDIIVSDSPLPANNEFPVIAASTQGEIAAWAQLILRYATGSGRSLVTHIATVNVTAAANSTDCDFDASAIIGPGAKGP